MADRPILFSAPMASERNLDAYYYSFDRTGVDAVDKILSAVAWAGRAYHHTEDWTEHGGWQRDDHTGETPVGWIKNAAKECAARIEALERVFEAAENVCIAHGMGWDLDGVLGVLNDNVRRARAPLAKGDK